MRVRESILSLLLAASVLAGCLADDGPTTSGARTIDYDAVEDAIGEPLDAPESAPDAVHLVRINLTAEQAGQSGGVAEGFVETAVKDGYAYLCRTGSNEGLVIFDVHDIENPVEVGYLKLDAGFEADIEVSDDGHWAFWETQRVGANPAIPDPDAPLGVLPRGIHIVDISDKANPTWVGYTPVETDGPHSITYANIGGDDYVFASIYSWQYVGTSGLVPVTLAPPGIQRMTIYRLDQTLPVAQLVEVSTYVDPDATEDPAMPTGGKMPHDVSVAVHPITNRTYAYIAYWDLGVVILDVTDPADPVKVGAATDFGEAPTKEIHMARQSEQLIDGKVIVVAEPEIGAQETTGYMSVIDVTDPANPVFVSNWRIPGNQDSHGGNWGPHYFDIRNGRVVVASYGAGFWVFDIHDHANLLDPRTVAYSFVKTAADNGLPGPLAGLGGGSAFDAWWADPTHIVASETGTGMAIFRYEGPTPPVATAASEPSDES